MNLDQCIHAQDRLGMRLHRGNAFIDGSLQLLSFCLDAADKLLINLADLVVRVLD